MEGGALVGLGSYGCVFQPSLPCNNTKSKRKSKKDTVSKIFFSDESLQEARDEFSINNHIREIKGYEQWASIWDTKCKPNEYDMILKKEPKIEKCIYSNHSSIYEFNKYRYMLLGPYAGISLKQYIKKQFKSKTYSSNKLFKQEFLKLMKYMKTLFIGLVELHKHGICHGDIKSDNIMFKDSHFTYIDFGLSCKYTNHTCFKDRSVGEFLQDRIYTPYPYEYIYSYVDDRHLDDEIYEISHKDFRSMHSRYVNIHEKIFNRENIDGSLIQLIDLVKDKKLKKNKMITLLDTYSLGVLIPGILFKYSKKLKKQKQFLNIIKQKQISPFIDLFKDMSNPIYYNRLTPDKSYKRYLELESVYLTKSSVKRKKKTKQKTKKKKKTKKK